MPQQLTFEPTVTATHQPMLPPLPALMETTPSARLSKPIGGMLCVAELLKMLMDGAHAFTDGDRELVRRLFELACLEN